MFRRVFLSALSAAPAIRLFLVRLQFNHPPTVPLERDLMFWHHLNGAIRRVPTHEYRTSTRKDREVVGSTEPRRRSHLAPEAGERGSVRHQ